MSTRPPTSPRGKGCQRLMVCFGWPRHCQFKANYCVCELRHRSVLTPPLLPSSPELGIDQVYRRLHLDCIGVHSCTDRLRSSLRSAQHQCAATRPLRSVEICYRLWERKGAVQYCCISQERVTSRATLGIQLERLRFRPLDSDSGLACVPRSGPSAAGLPRKALQTPCRAESGRARRTRLRRTARRGPP